MKMEHIRRPFGIYNLDSQQHNVVTQILRDYNINESKYNEDYGEKSIFVTDFFFGADNFVLEEFKNEGVCDIYTYENFLTIALEDWNSNLTGREYSSNITRYVSVNGQLGTKEEFEKSYKYVFNHSKQKFDIKKDCTYLPSKHKWFSCGDIWKSDLTGKKYHYHDEKAYTNSDTNETGTKEEFEKISLYYDAYNDCFSKEEYVVWIDCRSEFIGIYDAISSDLSGDFIHPDDILQADDGIYGTEQEFQNDGEYIWVEYGYNNDRYVHRNNCILAVDTDHYYHEDSVGMYVYFSDEHEEYYEELPECQDKEHICEYHCSPEPIDLTDGSKYAIGFEVEKTDFDGDSSVGTHIGEYNLFKGFETDSSCGVEAITNILPLDEPDSKHRKRVFSWMDEASGILEADVDNKCSCHVGLSIKDGGDVWDFLDKLRPNLGLIYAMFRDRLNNSYCKNNKNIVKDIRTKYSPINVQNRYIEIRIPSRIYNAKQLKRRYDLFYQLVVHSMEGDGNYDTLVTNVKPLLMEMYSDNENKVDRIISLSQMFNDYLVHDIVAAEIEQYIY